MVLPFCQYPVDSECYKKSELAKLEENEKDELFKLRETNNRIYFGSRKEVIKILLCIAATQVFMKG